jgi:hypothetical protein
MSRLRSVVGGEGFDLLPLPAEDGELYMERYGLEVLTFAFTCCKNWD